ncbi:hypothetical protein KUTeg_023741 [Tegillarca granosa]|uniref:Uncharacterized protein n=1 Tax=Tegillarca granosa TaxID=220873 RepID=A0ABQ9E7D8_TEGGR|nr:hypothetical protein KUTeg_023741 [Tegillarca granosa]
MKEFMNADAEASLVAQMSLEDGEKSSVLDLGYLGACDLIFSTITNVFHTFLNIVFLKTKNTTHNFMFVLGSEISQNGLPEDKRFTTKLTAFVYMGVKGYSPDLVGISQHLPNPNMYDEAELGEFRARSPEDCHIQSTVPVSSSTSGSNVKF